MPKGADGAEFLPVDEVPDRILADPEDNGGLLYLDRLCCRRRSVRLRLLSQWFFYFHMPEICHTEQANAIHNRLILN